MMVLPILLGKICEEYKEKDSRIQVIHQKNQGQSVARNVALKLATGDMLAFIDSDDFVEKDMIETLVKLLQKNQADLAVCSMYAYQNGKVIEKEYTYQEQIYNTDEALNELILAKKIGRWPCDKLYKKELWENLEFPVGRIFEDTVTIPKAFRNAKKIVFYDCPLYYYRKREGSTTTKRSKQQKLEYLKAELQMDAFLRNHHAQINDYLDYNIVWTTINIFHAVGKYGIEGLQKEKIVEELYDRMQQIMAKKEKMQFINDQCSNAKRIHLYYLLLDKTEYIKNVNYLPSIYQ